MCMQSAAGTKLLFTVQILIRNLSKSSASKRNGSDGSDGSDGRCGFCCDRVTFLGADGRRHRVR